MIRGKHSLKLLGLCGLVLGVVALGSNAVHAEKGAHWNVKGVSVTAELLPEVFMAKVATEDMTLVTKTGGAKVEVLCKGAEFIGARLEAEGKVGGGNKVKFSECQMKINEKLIAACEPHTGAEKGVMISAPLKGLIVLSAGKPVVLFEPVEGTVFLVLELSEKCTIGEKCPIIGKNSVEDVKGELGTESLTHTVKQGSISELWIISKTEEHKASILGEGVLELSGAHKGLKWSGVPA